MKHSIEEIKEWVGNPIIWNEDNIHFAISAVEDLLAENEKLLKDIEDTNRICDFRGKLADQFAEQFRGAEALAAARQKELAAAKIEADSLAMSLYRQYYRDEAPEWGLCDSVAGVITQIDNMVTGICEMLVKSDNLAASRLVDQEAIEKHTRRVVAEDCARIAENFELEDSDKMGEWIARAIRARFGEGK